MYAMMLLLFTSRVVREQIYDVMAPNELDRNSNNKTTECHGVHHATHGVINRKEQEFREAT